MIQKMKLSNLIMLNIISQTMIMMNLEIEARKIPAGPKFLRRSHHRQMQHEYQ